MQRSAVCERPMTANALMAQHSADIDAACAGYGPGMFESYEAGIQAARESLDMLLTGPFTPPVPTTTARPVSAPRHEAPEIDPGIFWTEEDFAPPPAFLELAQESLARARALPDIESLIPPLKLPNVAEITAAYEAQKSAEGRRELMKFYAAVTAGVLAVTGMFSITPTAQPIKEVLRPSTSTEVVISDTLEKALGDRALIRCVPEKVLDAFPGGKNIAGRAIPYSHIAWVHDTSCSILKDYIQSPVSYEQAMQDPIAKQRLISTAMAATILGHEYTHAVEGTLDESDTQCRTIPKIYKILAVAAGDADPSPDFINFVTGAVKEIMDEATKTEHTNYAIPPSCYDGFLKAS